MVLKNKNANCDLLPHNSNFFSQLCKQLPSLFFILWQKQTKKKRSELRCKDKILRKKSQLWDINLELWEKVKIQRFKFGIVGKSKNSEI